LANVAGAIYAFGDTCPHQQFSLAESVLKGFQVSCALHNWTFDVRDGKPCPPLIETRIPVYEVKVEAGSIKISLS
jgi:nitrite reductase/ring-hydroxylating ferredoxin subunit